MQCLWPRVQRFVLYSLLVGVIVGLVAGPPGFRPASADTPAPLPTPEGLPLPPTPEALPLLVTFVDRPPYYTVKDGEPQGVLLELARTILEDAGIAAVYQVRPAKRVLIEIRDATTPTCSIGWFKTPEREAVARFSLPFYQSAPMVVLTTPKRAAAIQAHPTITSLLADKRLMLSISDGFSYGPFLDPLIQGMSGNLDKMAVPVALILQKVAFDRTQYMFADPEEVEMLIRSDDSVAKTLVRVPFSDIPPGNRRHFMCSPAVSPEILDRINAVIRQRGLSD